MIPLSSSSVSKGGTTYGSGSLDVIPMISQNHIESKYQAGSDTTELSTESEDAFHNNDDVDFDRSCYTWKEYFASVRFVELMLCVFPFTSIYCIFETYPLVPHKRPIPFQEVYTANGNDLSHIWNLVNAEKFTGDTIGHYQYQILMGLCPFLFQLALVWFRAPRFSSGFDRLDAVHRTICIYFVGIGTTDAVCNCVKYYVGYLRPMFLDVCQPYYNKTDSAFHCSNDSMDARMSFPSNHSAWSFCGMLLLSMYLSKRFGVGCLQKNGAGISGATTKKDQLTHKTDLQVYYRLVSFLCYTPMLFAIFVAASRVVDNKHFPADVITGAVLGGSVASMVFGIWFPQ